MKNWKNNMRGLRVCKIVGNQIYAQFASHRLRLKGAQNIFLSSARKVRRGNLPISICGLPKMPL